MNYHVFRVLQPEEVGHIVGEIDRRTWVDGKLTAHGQAREVKNNLQAKGDSPDLDDLDRTVLQALQRTSEFQAFAVPKRAMKPLFSRYEVGMEYGLHVDSAITQGIRTDLALTLFLSPPTSYDGGELTIEMPYGEQEIKLDAGEAVLYSATSVHRVAPVTRGVRLAAVTWVQSSIRDEGMRGILFDLHGCLDQVDSHSPVALRLGKVYHNLLRYAAEP
jgi:PKHD-type hydroxylase